MSTPQSKQCPDCGRITGLAARFCEQCGHQYRTRFDAEPDDRTRAVPAGQAYQPPPPQAPYQPPQYQPPNSLQANRYRQGYRSDVIQKPPGTHPKGLAALLGFFLTGTGQMVNGQVAKGVVLLLVGIALAAPTAFVGTLLIGVLAWIDAIVIGNRIYEGEEVGQWQFF